MKRGKHVVPNMRGGWAVADSGSSRASKVFDTKSGAISYARDAAKKARTELYIHKKDGRVSEATTYAKDPLPPRDKKK